MVVIIEINGGMDSTFFITNGKTEDAKAIIILLRITSFVHRAILKVGSSFLQ